MINYLRDFWFYFLSLHTCNNPKSTSYAWIASAYVDETGIERTEDFASLLIITICINRNIALDSIDEQIESTYRLIDQIKTRIIKSTIPTLIVFSGGYFGYLYPDEGLTVKDLSDIKNMYFEGMENTTILIGLDTEETIGSGMQAWVFKDGRFSSVIERQKSPLKDRILELGENVKCAVFICGEFCNSKFPFNGSFYEDEYLDDDHIDDLYNTGVRVFISLSHFDIPRTKNNKPVKMPNPLRVHQKQMEHISLRKKAGVSVLTHNHEGMYGNSTKTEPHQNHRSDWILFNGGEWVDNNVQAFI